MILNKVKVKDLGKVITGTTPPTKIKEYYADVYNFIKPSYIEKNVRFFNESEEKLSEQAKEKYINTFVPELSTCVVTIGSIGEKICLTKELCLTNQQINTVIPNEKYDNMFVYYLLKYNLFKVKAANSGSSSGRENVSKSTFENIEVDVPNLQIQNKIAKVLSAYDDLIENNLRRIKLLEESAELLYKEWFINFRFPGYEEYEFLNGVPNGWKKKKVGELILKFKRKSKVKKEDYLEAGEIPIIDQSKSFIGGYTDNEDAKEESVPAIIFGDHTRIVKYIDFPFASGADGTQLIYSNSTEVSQQYFYWAIKNIDLSNYSYARHFKYLKDEEIYIPSKTVMEKFSGIVGYNFKQITNLRNQNNKLIEARDILLPKLIIGEIEV